MLIYTEVERLLVLIKEQNLVRLTIPPRSEIFKKTFESLQLVISKIAVLLAGLIIVLYVGCIQFILVS